MSVRNFEFKTSKKNINELFKISFEIPYKRFIYTIDNNEIIGYFTFNNCIRSSALLKYCEDIEWKIVENDFVKNLERKDFTHFDIRNKNSKTINLNKIRDNLKNEIKAELMDELKNELLKTNQIQENNETINSFEFSNYECISEKVFNSLLEIPENFIYEFIEKLHFNPEIKENHNIYVSNFHTKRIMIFHENIWKNEDFNIYFKIILEQIENNILKIISSNKKLFDKFLKYKDHRYIDYKKIFNLMYSKKYLIIGSSKEKFNIPIFYDDSIFYFNHYTYNIEKILNDNKNNEIYIIQLREFLNTFVYKIGITGRTAEIRLKDYPPGSILLKSYKVKGNPESEIIDLFKINFNKYIYGNEYFIGDLEKMNEIISSFLLNNPKYLY